MTKQPPLTLHGSPKGEMRTQFAALCYRVRKDKVQVLIVTSRRTKRWIMPKGWPMEGRTPGGSALQEAWEEAGVRGEVTGGCLGVYSYQKDDVIGCLAMLYPVKVASLAGEYPEKGERRRRWVSRKKAARLVQEPELGQLILGFDPRKPGAAGRGGA